MNYLAHAFLSFDEPQILAGNMISDHVKGKRQFDYAVMIQKGIRLHRAIDQFTDTHPAIKEMKKPFRQTYGLYAGAFVDIVCDYFLANDRNEFASKDLLASFSKDTYTLLEPQLVALPWQFQQYFNYMRAQNWLYNYQFEWMIAKSFNGIARRATFMQEADTAYDIFINNIDHLRPYYIDFFPLLKEFALGQFRSLKNGD